MNIYDLPIPNFGELSNEDALKLILEVRERRRVNLVKHSVPSKSQRKVSSEPRGKTFNTPFGKFTKEEIRALLENLK